MSNMPSIMEELEKKSAYMDAPHTINDVSNCINNATEIKNSYRNGTMKKNNPLMYFLFGGIVGKKKDLTKAIKTLVKAGLVLAAVQLIAQVIVWLTSLF